MPGVFRTQRRVEFCETDAAGIAHFAAFFPYMEQAEHALLRHLGLSVVSEDDQGIVSWPRVSAHCDYTGAARFEDVLDVTVQVEKLGSRSVTYAFVFTRHGDPIAQGQLTAVCCRVGNDKRLQSIPIPARIREPLERFWQAID
jgi:4-hydroxybenzoyl-CoA thioesterase/acyl-CoA thioester hydrolase